MLWCYDECSHYRDRHIALCAKSFHVELMGPPLVSNRAEFAKLGGESDVKGAAAQ